MLLRLLSINGFSRWVGRRARSRAPGFLLRWVMKLYVRIYGVQLEEAALPLTSFKTFNEFFTRELKPGLRPISKAPFVSPVDGIASMMGSLSSGVLTQIKGKEYTLSGLLRDPELAARFRKGSYLTLYLSPRHYHRIHTPVGGKITGYRYIPGRLFPVNDRGLEQIDELFVVNERLASIIETEQWGAVAVVKVGATNVGSITLSYDETETNQKGQPARAHDFETPIPIKKGDELGRFNLGSTVVLLVESPQLKWQGFSVGDEVVVGQALAQPEGNQSVTTGSEEGAGS